MSGRSRRYAHEGVYFPDMHGLRAALIDMGQLTLCLRGLLRERGLLDAELVERRGTGQRPSGGPAGPHSLPAISVREALEALESAYRVFSNAASVIQRVEQAIEQCGLMFDAAEAMGDERAQEGWATAFNVCANVSVGACPVPRAETKAARAALRGRDRDKAGSGHG